MSNHHYYTRACLDKFVHPTSAQRVLYPYTINGKKCKPRGAAKLACAIDFYTQKINGQFTERLEEARSKAETILFNGDKGPFFECIYNKRFVPTNDDLSILNGISAYLHASSPVQIHNVAMQTLYCGQINLFNSFNTKSAEAEYRKTYGGDWETYLKIDRDKVLNGELFIDVEDDQRKQLGLESFQYQEIWGQELSKMNFSIVESKGSPFITSDNPAILFSEHRKINVGLCHKDAQVWLPLSHNIGLLWHNKDLPRRFTFGHSKIRAMNRRIIKHAYKFIYCPLPEDWIDSAIQNVSKDHILKHYGTLQRVISMAHPAVDQNGNSIGDVIDFLEVFRTGNELDILNIRDK